ncbi:hypothetical protein [Alteromonas sp. 14N.309.X.WAT.G.H12]|uniref:hypothetical protein n=1 Tax=Alteromonas sp. 14N.309.X.WAT.G.H12 TaxID=3120824 RepID=UPI002FD4C04C
MVNQIQVTELNDSIDNLLALLDYDTQQLGDILASDLETLTDLKHHVSALTEAVRQAERQVVTLS